MARVVIFSAEFAKHVILDYNSSFFNIEGSKRGLKEYMFENSSAPLLSTLYLSLRSLRTNTSSTSEMLKII